MSCGHIECPAGWCRERADRFRLAVQQEMANPVMPHRGQADAHFDRSIRSAPTQAPPPSKLLADDLRLRADRLGAIRRNLLKEENDLRDAADRIERGDP